MEVVSSTPNALNQFLEPLSRTLGVEAARALVALQIEPKIQDRIEELAELCNEGLLTEADRTEYEAYVEGAEILALLRLNARRYLANHGEG